MPIAKDIWRPILVEAPMADIIRAGSVDGHAHRWLPPEGFLHFLADPFGMVHDGGHCLFVEAYDYRTRHGTIECLLLDERYQIIERRPVLAEPWHLSYPFVFEAEGRMWMLPEAHRSGGLTLYRAVEFPWRWERVCSIELDHIAVDATPLFHDGLWWLLYASANDAASKTGALFAACAERLEGPWRPHPANPLRRDKASTRPGGTPVSVDGRLVLPVQDCSWTYGGAIRPLWIDRLSPDTFEAEAGEMIRPPSSFAPFTQGLHTMAAVGDVTLIDVKRRLLSPRSLAVLARRELLGR